MVGFGASGAIPLADFAIETYLPADAPTKSPFSVKIYIRID